MQNITPECSRAGNRCPPGPKGANGPRGAPGAAGNNGQPGTPGNDAQNMVSQIQSGTQIQNMTCLTNDIHYNESHSDSKIQSVFSSSA